MALKFLNGIHVSGETQLDFMPTHESEGVLRLGRYDANTTRYHDIKSYVSSTQASNYLKFSLHGGTGNTVADVLTLKGDLSATFAGTVTAPTFIGALTGTASNANLLDNIDSTLFANFCNLTFVDSSESTVRSTSYPTPARSNNPDPNDYGRVFHTEMKQASSIGASIGGSCYWAGLVSMAPYSGSTNWYTTQITFGADGTSDKLLTRRGTGTSWGSWRQIITADSATFTEDVTLAATKRLIFADDKIKIGSNSTPGAQGIQVGYAATASGAQAIAFGYDSNATGNQSIAMGYNSTASGTYSQAYGYNVDATGTGTVVFGTSGSHSDANTFVASGLNLKVTGTGNSTFAGTVKTPTLIIDDYGNSTASDADGWRLNSTSLYGQTDGVDKVSISSVTGAATFSGTVTANGTLLTGNTGTVTGTGTDNRLALWNGTTAIDSDADFYVTASTLHTYALQITSDNNFYRETINSNTGGESWIAGNGWHRIIEISGGSGRGKCHFLIQTGGGSGTPCRVEAIVNTAWSNANATLSILHNSYPNFITDIRVVRNTTSNKAFVDIKGGGEDYVDVTILPAGSTSAALVNFTNVNTLPSGDSKQIEKTITGKIMSLAAGTGTNTSGWRPFQVSYDGSISSNVVTAYSPAGNAYAANFLASTGSASAKFYQDSNNHMSLYMAATGGTNNVVLNTNGVSYIKGGNLIVGGSADSGELLQVEGTSAFAGTGTFTVSSGSNIELRKGNGTGALGFGGTSHQTGLIEGVDGGGLKLYTAGNDVNWGGAWALNTTWSGTGMTVAGTIAASNLSGTNTGDQDLSGYVTLASAQTISGNKTFTGTGNTFNGHLYYSAYDSQGQHYPHFRDGTANNGADINWRHYYGSSYKTHTWTSDGSGNMVFTFQGQIKAVGELEGTSLDINGNADISGALAVGGSNTTYKLNVHEGDMFVGATSAAGGRGIYFKRTSANNSWSLIQGHNGTHAFELREGNDTRMLWKNGGDVGIGTIDPGYRLEIAEDTDGTADLLMLRNSDATYAQTWAFQSDTNKDLVITGSSGAGGVKFVPGSRGVNITGSLVVTGDFQVNGITTTTNVVNLDVSDNIIGLNRGSTSNANDSGLIIERGSTGDNAAFLWDESADAFVFGTTTANPAATGNITYAYSPIKASAATFSGDISLTGGANIQTTGTDTSMLIGTSASGTSGVLTLKSTGTIKFNQYGSAWADTFTVTGAGDATFAGNLTAGNAATDKTVVVGNLGIGPSSYPKIAYPGSNALWGGNSSTTGQIVIDIPGTLANYDMMYMEIDVYEYSSDNASKIIIGGHNWNSGGNSNTSAGQWHNVGVKVIGSLSKPIYLGRRNDGSNERRCIAIGAVDSTWSYATVHVSKVHGAEFYSSAIDWVGDWNIAQTTSSSYFTANPTTNWNSGTTTTFRTPGNLRAPLANITTSITTPKIYGDPYTYIMGPSGTYDGRLKFKPYSGGREWTVGNESSNFRIQDDSAGVTRLWFDYDGKTGLNTKTPAALFTINGAGDALRVESTNTGAGGAQVDLLHFTTSPADEDVHGVINMGGYYTGTTSVYGSQIKSIWTDVSERHSRIEFSTCDTSLSTALTLAHDNSATFTGTLNVSSSSANGYQAQFTATNSGGEASVEIKGGEAGNARLRLIADEGDDVPSSAKTASDHKQIIHKAANNDFAVQQYDSSSGWHDLLTVTSTGNVTAANELSAGDDINTPTKVVIGESATAELRLKKTDAGTASIKFYNNDGSNSTSVGYIQLDASEDLVYYRPSGGKHWFYGSGSSRFQISGDVKVVGATDFHIPTGRKLCLDGGGTTYLTESSDGVIDFYGDGVQLFTTKQNGTQSEVVVNEGSGDVDFRVESNNSTHAFFVEAEAKGKVGIGDDNPDRKLSIIGDDSSEGQYPLSLDATNTDYTMEFRRNGTSEWWIKQSSSSFIIHENGVGDQLTVAAGGNTTIDGSVTADSLIKSGGTSSQYLMADGSVSTTSFSGGTVANATTFSEDVTVTKQILGVRKNHCTMEDWTTGGFNMSAHYGGDYTGGEATNAYGEGPYGTRELIQETVPDSGNDFDGGWNKSLTNLDINKAYMSIVYVKRITSQTSGSFYHGTGAGTNQIFNLNGTSNTNPYFISWGISNLPQDVWCVSVGYIQANNDSNTANGNWAGQGLYRLDTGERIYQGSAYKMGSAGATLSTGHRVFLYYSSDNTSKLQFARPGFYEVNGHHPTINELVNPGGYAHQGATNNRTFAGAVSANEFDLPSSGQIEWSNGDARIVEGLVNNYSLSFQTYDGSACSTALRLDGDNTATFAGKVSTNGASTDFHANASNLVVGSGSGNQGMTIFSGSSVGNYGSIYFADGRADGMEEYRGMITYEQNNEIMRFHTAGHSTPALKLDLSRNATFGGAQVNLLDSNVLRIGTGADLQLFHDGSHSYLQSWTGSWNFRNFQADGNTVFAADNGAGGGNIADYFTLDGGSAVHDGTTFTELHTKWQDKSRVSLGSGKDLQLYHDGSNSYIKNLTGWLNMPISQNGVSIANADFSASIARFLLGGACELYHNGTKRIETTSYGAKVIGQLNTEYIKSDDDIEIVPVYDDTIQSIVLGKMAGSNSGSSSGDNPIHQTILAGYSVDWSGGTRLSNEGFLMWHSGGGWTGNQRHWALTNAYDMGGTGGPKFALLLGNANTVEPTLGSNGALGTNTQVATYWKNDKHLIHGGAATFNMGSGVATMTSTTSPLLVLNPTANNYGGISFQYGGANKGAAMYNSGMMVFGGEADTHTRLQAGGQYGLHIDKDNRNVSIGSTADTGYKLGVTGTLYVSSDATFAGDIIVNGGDAGIKKAGADTLLYLQNTASVTSGNRGDIAFYNSDTSTVGLIRAGAVTDNVGTELSFWTRPAGGSLTETFTLESDGNATFANHVKLKTGNNLYFDTDTHNHTYIKEEGDNQLKFYIGGSQHAVFGGGAVQFSPSSTFTVDAGGQINLDSGNAEIHLKGSGTTFGKLYTSGGDFYINHPTSNEDIIIRGNDGGSGINALTFDMSEGGKATFNNDVIAFSDRKLKKDIKTLDGSKVYDMRGVSFTRIDTNNPGAGVIAQEMQEVAPELVNETDGTLGVSYGNITGYLIEAIKDLKAEIEELKKCNKCENCNCENK